MPDSGQRRPQRSRAALAAGLARPRYTRERLVSQCMARRIRSEVPPASGALADIQPRVWPGGQTLEPLFMQFRSRFPGIKTRYRSIEHPWSPTQLHEWRIALWWPNRALATGGLLVATAFLRLSARDSTRQWLRERAAR